MQGTSIDSIKNTTLLYADKAGLTLSQFLTHIELESITQDEVNDEEYMMDRIDTWAELD
jgi:hypothetical protein